MNFLSVWIGKFLLLIYGFVGNYGISIVILTIIVKALLYPLYMAQTKSMARMAQVQPKMQAIQKQYANDQETMNLKMQELYKEENYNPMMGCLPMVIQLPILWGLFALLRNPLNYMGESSSLIVAVHESFLWISDLSQVDKWILPILAGIATYISYVLMQNQQQVVGAQQNQMGGMMKMMKYIFPLMIVWMARSFPAGLALYWFVSQFIQIFISLRMNAVRRRIVAEGKARERQS